MFYILDGCIDLALLEYSNQTVDDFGWFKSIYRCFWSDASYGDKARETINYSLKDSCENFLVIYIIIIYGW